MLPCSEGQLGRQQVASLLVGDERQVKNGSLLKQDFKSGQLSKGATGACPALAIAYFNGEYVAARSNNVVKVTTGNGSFLQCIDFSVAKTSATVALTGGYTISVEADAGDLNYYPGGEGYDVAVFAYTVQTGTVGPATNFKNFSIVGY